jgi:hypothetical protein
VRTLTLRWKDGKKIICISIERHRAFIWRFLGRDIGYHGVDIDIGVLSLILKQIYFFYTTYHHTAKTNYMCTRCGSSNISHCALCGSFSIYM